jgi:hypothetical protein
MADEVSDNDLDALQQVYKAAAADWIATIQHEMELASVDHSLAKLDDWENAHIDEEEARNKADAAKSAYEDALRQRFFGL